MGHLGKLTSTPYLVLFIILGAVGITAVSAAGVITFSNPLDMSNNQINNLGSPTQKKDAATKQYVDSNSVSFSECGTGKIVTGVDTSGQLTCENIRVVRDFFSFPEGVDGRFHSMALGSDNFPIFTYTDDSSTTVKVLHCTNPNCITNDLFIELDPDSAAPSSLTIGSDNFPIISYSTSLTFQLRVVHCTTVDCSSRDPIQTLAIDAIPNAITTSSDGLAIIVYHHIPTTSLRIVKCTNPSCSTISTNILDSAASPGVAILSFPTIALGSDGNPIVAYRDDINDELRFVHCKDPSCSMFDSPIVLDTNGDTGRNLSLTVGDDGFPIMSYVEELVIDKLKVIHCINPKCTTPDPPTTITAEFNCCYTPTSIVIGANSLPLIAYGAGGNIDLKLIKCTTQNCTSFDAPITLDSIGLVGGEPSMIIGAEGLPQIVYNDVTTTTMTKFIRVGGILLN